MFSDPLYGRLNAKQNYPSNLLIKYQKTFESPVQDPIVSLITSG
jgi:hypothetical protein